MLILKVTTYYCKRDALDGCPMFLLWLTYTHHLLCTFWGTVCQFEKPDSGTLVGHLPLCVKRPPIYFLREIWPFL